MIPELKRRGIQVLEQIHHAHWPSSESGRAAKKDSQSQHGNRQLTRALTILLIDK
jgi:hypothetical protein